MEPTYLNRPKIKNPNPYKLNTGSHTLICRFQPILTLQEIIKDM